MKKHSFPQPNTPLEYTYSQFCFNIIVKALSLSLATLQRKKKEHSVPNATSLTVMVQSLMSQMLKPKDKPLQINELGKKSICSTNTMKIHFVSLIEFKSFRISDGGATLASFSSGNACRELLNKEKNKSQKTKTKPPKSKYPSTEKVSSSYKEIFIDRCIVCPN